LKPLSTRPRVFLIGHCVYLNGAQWTFVKLKSYSPLDRELK
jgi:hypothetical protein